MMIVQLHERELPMLRMIIDMQGFNVATDYVRGTGNSRKSNPQPRYLHVLRPYKPGWFGGTVLCGAEPGSQSHGTEKLHTSTSLWVCGACLRHAGWYPR